MSNVHTLPDSFERQWRVYESNLRPALATHTTATAEEIDYAMARLRPIYLDCARFDFKSGATGDELVQELNLWVAQQVGGLLLQIAARDCELYSLKGGTPGEAESERQRIEAVATNMIRAETALNGLSREDRLIAADVIRDALGDQASRDE